eukprot:TRINITY_DN63894_c0_g1_i1.p1 TRINITY_DN63894_c0_g1~~TRINITY_DN63894_c0_g1_i1.p1  ORF type:complete len:661 (-),score=191.14 TRINITY_DN63894_c0_g1_i1:72-2054(-)
MDDMDGSGFDFGAPPLPDSIRREVIKKADPKHYKYPKKGDEVTVDYKGTLEDGTEFDSSHSREGPLKFTLGKGQVIKGWDLCVATMKQGEIAKFTMPPEYAYGEEGSMPSIPPNATLTFTIELVSWESKNDLFGDGLVIKTVTADGSGFEHPKAGGEVRLTLRVLAEGGAVEDERRSIDYAFGSGELGPLTKVVEKTLLSMTTEEKCYLKCARSYVYGEGAAAGDITIEIALEEMYQIDDVSILKDHTVTKKQLNEGSGHERPKDAARVTVTVEAATDGKARLSGFTGPKDLTFTVGDGDVCDALEGAVQSMAKDERALVTVKVVQKACEPKLGLEKVQAAKVVFTLVLKHFTKLPDMHSVSDTYKVEYAAQRKDVGAKLFKMQRWELALDKYKRILDLFRDMKKFNDDEKPKALELKRAAELNRAACFLKLDDFGSALTSCTNILKEDPTNVKALFRRAKAHYGRAEYTDAVRDLERLLEQEPTNADARALLPSAKKGQKAADKESRGTFSKMCQGFGKMGDIKPKVPPPPPKETVPEEPEQRQDIVVVNFRIEYKPQEGETVGIVGSAEALGSWDEAAGVKMRKLPPKWEPPTGSGRAPPEQHIWEAAVELPEAEGRVEYRYIIRGPGGDRLEPGKHAVNLGGLGGSRQRLTDSWREH